MMRRIRPIARYLDRRRAWLLAATLLLALPGALIAPVPDLHWLSRRLIAGGLVFFSLAMYSAALDRRGTTVQHLSLGAIGTLAVAAAIDEVLPDAYRSSNVLLIIAAFTALFTLLFVVGAKIGNNGLDPRQPTGQARNHE